MKNVALIILCAIASIFIAAVAAPVMVFATPVTIRWGNFKHPDFPAKPPIYVQNDLIGRNPTKFNFVGRSSKTNTAAGKYTFPESLDCRQVIWIADSLLKKKVSFSVDGFPWVVDLEKVQSITIMNVPGKAFTSGNQNGGEYTIIVK